MLGRSAPCLHLPAPALLVPTPRDGMGWERCEQSRFAAPAHGPARAHPLPGGTAGLTSPSNRGSRCVPAAGPIPGVPPLLPRAEIASPGVAKIRPQHCRATERIGKGWIVGAQGVGALPGLLCAASQLLRASSCCSRQRNTAPCRNQPHGPGRAHSPSGQEDGAGSRDPSTDQLLFVHPELQHSLSPQEDRRNWNLQHPAAPTAWIYPFQTHKKGTYQPGIQTMV